MAALQERDTNIQMKTESSQAIQSKSNEVCNPKLMKQSGAVDDGTYVSPSDAIMSPASQKLAHFKQRQINRQNNSTRRTLFARSASAVSGNSVHDSQASEATMN